jgi:hypothetical protein
MLRIFADALLIAARFDPPREDQDSRRRVHEAEPRRTREHMVITNLRF